MKILFFIEDLNSGGKERRLVELIKGLSYNPDLKMGIVLTRDIIHYKDILSAEIRIFYVKRRKGLRKDYRVFYQFFNIARDFKPDIIHVWGNLPAIFAIPAKVLLRIPMINNQITDAPASVSNSILSHKLTFPFSDRVIANTYAGLMAYKAPKNKSRVIYNGFDFNRIKNLERKETIRKRFGIDTKYVIAMVASFTIHKDYKTYIQAANEILTKYDNITFLCVGGGNSKSFQTMVNNDNKKNILFLGKQDHVESIMNICDLGVLMSSNTHGEGISNALLEFMALSKPVIATKSGGNIELIEQGETGFLIEQGSSDELKEKILYLFRKREERIRIGNNARRRVIEKFSIQKMITFFIKEYDEILKTKI